MKERKEKTTAIPYFLMSGLLSCSSSTKDFHGGIPTPRRITLPFRLTAMTSPLFTISFSPCRTARSVSFLR